MRMRTNNHKSDETTNLKNNASSNAMHMSAHRMLQWAGKVCFSGCIIYSWNFYWCLLWSLIQSLHYRLNWDVTLLLTRIKQEPPSQKRIKEFIKHACIRMKLCWTCCKCVWIFAQMHPAMYVHTSFVGPLVSVTVLDRAEQACEGWLVPSRSQALMSCMSVRAPAVL